MGAVMAKQSNRLLIVVLVGLGAAVFGVVALAASLVVVGFVSEMRNPTAATKATAAGKVWEREEFKAAVIGKTQDEVKALLGVPGSTSDSGGESSWIYDERTRDAITGKIDLHVWIHFENGIAKRFMFS